MSIIKPLILAIMMALSFSLNAAESINLNQADAATLAAGIEGIGPAKAAAIVAWREQHGPFKTIDDLLMVKGIGSATLDKNRGRLSAATP